MPRSNLELLFQSSYVASQTSTKVWFRMILESENHQIDHCVRMLCHIKERNVDTNYVHV